MNYIFESLFSYRFTNRIILPFMKIAVHRSKLNGTSYALHSLANFSIQFILGERWQNYRPQIPSGEHVMPKSFWKMHWWMALFQAEAAFEMFKNHQAFIVRKDMAFDVLFKGRFRDLKKQVKEGKFNKKSSAGANKAWRFSNAKKLLVEAFKNKTLSVDAFDGRRVRSRELGSIPTPICLPIYEKSVRWLLRCSRAASRHTAICLCKKIWLFGQEGPWNTMRVVFSYLGSAPFPFSRRKDQWRQNWYCCANINNLSCLWTNSFVPNFAFESPFSLYWLWIHR